MRVTPTLSAMSLCLILAGCGTSQNDRALSGAGIGAGIGAVGSSLTGGNALTGAVIGGAAGAATGAFTDKDDIDLGRPAWRDKNGKVK